MKSCTYELPDTKTNKKKYEEKHPDKKKNNSLEKVEGLGRGNKTI